MVSRIDGKAIVAMGARTLIDVLELVPEVDVSRNVAGRYQVAIRGMRSAGDVLVAIDGQVIMADSPGPGSTKALHQAILRAKGSEW